MSQDECSTEARMYTRRKPKEGTATAPTERHCADKARHTKGSKTKSPFCVVLKTYHLDTWILHKTCLKHSNFLPEKLCVQSFPHGTSWQQQWDREPKKTKQVETRFKTRQLQHAPSPDWARSPNCVQFFKSLDSAGSARKRGECCIEPNCYEWNICQHKMRKQEKINKKKHFAKRGKQQHGSPNMDQHEFSKTAGNEGNEECVKTVTLDQVTITVSNAEQQLNTDTLDDELNADS